MMKQPLPVCPDTLPHDLQEPLKQFARTWAASSLRPAPDFQTLAHWDTLITQWSQTPDLPLLIRKPSAGRGQFLHHPSGRILVPVDNSPPHWSFLLALQGETPDLDAVRTALNNDQIPVAMILKKKEVEQAQLKHTRTKSENLNSAGWKLAHIQPVGLNNRLSLCELPIELLREHFIRLMSPSNMFVVPLSLAGLGEMPVMIDAIREGLRAER